MRLAENTKIARAIMQTMEELVDAESATTFKALKAAAASLGIEDTSSLINIQVGAMLKAIGIMTGVALKPVTDDMDTARLEENVGKIAERVFGALQSTYKDVWIKEGEANGYTVKVIRRQKNGKFVQETVEPQEPPKVVESTVTERDYSDAIQVQNACNGCGILQSWADVAKRLNHEITEAGGSTDKVNTHPIMVMYANKMYDLTRCKGNYLAAEHRCNVVAEGRV